MNAMIDEGLLPAWENAVHASQASFRCVLDALARPGTLHTLPVEVVGPMPLMPSTTALCLALADLETPVWLDGEAERASVASYLRFHCGCPLTDDPATASFGVIADALVIDLQHFAQGTMEYPDRSTTLLIQVTSLSGGPVRTMSGPGIRDTAQLEVDGLPDDFTQRWRQNTAAFPTGVDIIFCCGNEIVGLPRTTHIVEAAPCM